MFKRLSEKLYTSLEKLKNKGRLSSKNIKDAIRDVRTALLEADVSFLVVKNFISRVQKEALTEKIKKSLTPGQTFISIVKKELIKQLGNKNESLNLSAQHPVVILLTGLQGSGKTTTTVKLAKRLKEINKKKVMVVSVDIYRPAAMKQLEMLAHSINIHYYKSNASSSLEIAKNALEEAKKQFYEVLIVDTAGRLHIDNNMMKEIKNLHQILQPTETLFIVDSMIGQEAANITHEFNKLLNLTGIILTKIDSDARGGAALSISEITGKPIKFIGVGENINELDAFHPERMASRILGMGDVLSFIEEVEQKINKKTFKQKSYTLDDFKIQLKQITKFGGINSMIEKLPFMSAKIKNNINKETNENSLMKMEAIINSMTLQERKNPSIIKYSRKLRISNGSGSKITEINKLLKHFSEVKKIIKKTKKRGLKNFKNFNDFNNILK